MMNSTNEYKAPKYLDNPASIELWDSVIEHLLNVGIEPGAHELELVENYVRVSAYSKKIDLEAMNTPALNDDGKANPIHATAISLQNSIRASHKSIENLIESRLKNPSIGQGKGQAGVRKKPARDGVPSLVEKEPSGISWLDDARRKASIAR